MQHFRCVYPVRRPESEALWLSTGLPAAIGYLRHVHASVRGLGTTWRTEGHAADAGGRSPRDGQGSPNTLRRLSVSAMILCCPTLRAIVQGSSPSPALRAMT